MWSMTHLLIALQGKDANLAAMGVRERILHTAHALFYREGIRATGIDRIIGEAHVTKVTFYRQFPSKHDLVAAYLEHRHALWMQWFKGALADAPPDGDFPLQCVLQALQAFEINFAAGAETVSHDLAFHLSIAQATGNRYFQDILQHFGSMLIPRTRIASIDKPARDPDYLRRVNREHEEIYAAIERQDADSARAAMRIHLTNSRERLRLAQRQSAGTAVQGA